MGVDKSLAPLHKVDRMGTTASPGPSGKTVEAVGLSNGPRLSLGLLEERGTKMLTLLARPMGLPQASPKPIFSLKEARLGFFSLGCLCFNPHLWNPCVYVHRKGGRGALERLLLLWSFLVTLS